MAIAGALCDYRRTGTSLGGGCAAPRVSGAEWLQIATNTLHANGPFSMAIWSWTAPLKPNNRNCRPQLGMPFAGKSRGVDFSLAEPPRTPFFMAAVVMKVRRRYVQNGTLAKNRPSGISLQMARRAGAWACGYWASRAPSNSRKPWR